MADPCVHDNNPGIDPLRVYWVADTADLLPSKHPIVTGMADDESNELNLRLRIDSEEERAALEQALLRARATELAEVRRNQVRLSAGYGDATTRDSMTGEAGRAQLRLTMLDRLLTELRARQPLTDRPPRNLPRGRVV